MDSELSNQAPQEAVQNFKLVDVYEVQITHPSWPKIARVEIFQSLAIPLLFRARVWLDEHYNLYPSAFNTDSQGRNFQSVHSADILNKDITVILPFAEELIKGKVAESKDQYANALLSQVQDFLKDSLAK